MTTNSNVNQKEPQILLFDDFTSSDFLEQLRSLLYAKNNPILSDLFGQVSFNLRRCIGNLPSCQRELFPRFTSLIDLVSRIQGKGDHPSLQLVLFTVAQIAHFIQQFSHDTTAYPSPASTYIISTGVGSFAAAAVSCSQSIPGLIPLAVEAALAAFRTGLRSYIVGEALSTGLDAPLNVWSVSLSSTLRSGQSVEQLLGKFTDSMTVPANNKVLWISATSPSGTMILSGKPPALQSFIAANEDSIRHTSLDVVSPLHAAHIFGISDIDQIMDGVSLHTAPSPSQLTIFSASGHSTTALDFTSRLRRAVHETLRDPVHWDSILESCGKHLDHLGIRKCRLTPFTSSNTTTSMVSEALSQTLEIELVMQEPPHPNSDHRPSGRFDQSKIAIVGYSGRFPSAESNEAFWDLLREGRDVHHEIPDDRFDWQSNYDENGQKVNTSRIKHGCFIDRPGEFDAQFFSMSPREAKNTDPAHRLAILTAYEAMEMAGFVRNRTPSSQEDRVGVFFGTTSDDWREGNSSQNIDTYFIPGGNRAFIPGRISYFFRLSGPSLSIDTACSSSFAAIHTACGYLWRGECDTAIAGGTNVLTNPNIFSGLDRAHFLSTTGNCNAFDDEANGYCRADGIGSVILKRLEDAEEDNDPILGVILGASTNHCGQTGSITRPHEGDQANLFQQIIRKVDYDPLDIDYIEMHGTGTQAGDSTEMSSILSVFVPERKRTTLSRPLYIGSAKSNVGHAESASGITSLIKVLLMLKQNEIPPHCGIKTTINRNYPLDLVDRGVHIANKPTPWHRNPLTGKRAAFLNNFSAAGGNTAILLEDAPCKQEDSRTRAPDRRSVHLVAVTARTQKSLVDNIARLAAWTETQDIASLSALSYTTTARRMHHNYRVMVSGESKATLLQKLKKLATQSPKSFSPIPPPGRKPRVVFAFTGQGKFYIGMGSGLFKAYPSFREDIIRFNDLAQSRGSPSFIGVIDGTSSDLQSISTGMTHLALVCVQMALVNLLGRWKIRPEAVIGHSLGEYSALYASGVISAGDAIYLVVKRAMFLEEHCTKGSHSMLVVKASRNDTEMLLQHVEDSCELACANHPTAHVIAGPKRQISEAAITASRMSLKTVELEIPFAFHSSQVDPILPGFETAAKQATVAYHPPKIPVLSPALARVVPVGDNNTLNASYLVQACRSTVDFAATLKTARAHFGEDMIWLEVGAHPTCTYMIKETLGPQETTLSTLKEKENGCKSLAELAEALYLAGIDIDWNEYHREFSDAHQVIDLPRYSWDLKNYWIQYQDKRHVTMGKSEMDTDGRETRTVPEKHKYISPALQRVIEEVYEPEQSSVIVESEVFDERLLPVFQGHAVNGVSLCPSSLYAEIALTLGDYLLAERNVSQDTTGLEICNLRIDQPLIAMDNETTHCFRTTATANWHCNSIEFAIFSVDAAGKQTTSHAKLTVHAVPIHDQQWLSDWKRSAHLVTSRIKALELDSKSHTLKRPMAYKLFASLVDYSDSYRGMSEVVLNSEDFEAVSTVNFQVGHSDRKHGVDARWIDSLGQVSGFIMNANDTINSKEQVFINHGWEILRYAETLDPSKTYRVYCRMHLVEKTTYVGDAFVMDGDRVVGIYQGIKFVGMRRQILNHILPSTTNRSTPAPKKDNLSSLVSQNKLSLTKSVKESVLDTHNAHSLMDSSSRLLGIISQELGVLASELHPDTQLADLGVDSLLSLTVSSRINQELNLQVSGPALLDCSYIRDLQKLCDSQDSYAATPLSESDKDSSSGNSDMQSQDTSMSILSETASSDSSNNEQIQIILRELISEETSAPTDELSSTTCLADMGIDSLLALTISAKLNDKFGANIPSSVVMACDTVFDMELALYKAMDLNLVMDSPKSSRNDSPVRSSHDQPNQKPIIRSAAENSDESRIKSSPHATSIFLGGSKATAQTIMILFPDGSGSAASYANMAPKFPNDVAVYGLNCPWRKTGDELIRLGISVSQMVAKHLLEICRILDDYGQSNLRGSKRGTRRLVLAGWSAGGILALEGVRQLHEEGIVVDKLVLLDAPNPIGLQNPPQKMFHFLDSQGILGQGRGRAPAWVLAHFDGMVKVLDIYRPKPLPTDIVPDTLIIYARDGICKDPNGPRMETRPGESREMLWLLNNRTDFSAGGWSSLLGSQKLAVEVVDDVNHFTMMDEGPKMTQLCDLLVEFVRPLAREHLVPRD